MRGPSLSAASIAIALLVAPVFARADGSAQLSVEQVGIDQPEHGRQVERIAVQILPKPIPARSGAGEELLRLGAPPRQHAFEPAIVLPRG